MFWSIDEFCEGFVKLIDHLELTKVSGLFDYNYQLLHTPLDPKVHIFGASLGAFLGQKLAEKTVRSPRVESIFICNGFTDTTAFKQTKVAKTSVNNY